MNVPYVQRKTTALVSGELSELFGTEVQIGKINAGLLNRIIIDDLLMHDREGKDMLKVSRLSAKYDIFPLFRGRISIGSVQLFGFTINLNKKTADAESNFKFILDTFASNDSVQRSTNIDLRINSVLIRRGTLAYDVLSVEETPGKFNPNHIKLYNVIGNVSLKALQNDSINAQIKRFSVDEQSGLELRKLNLKVLGNHTGMTIENFEVELPGTSLQMDTIKMQYDSLAAFKRFMTDVKFSFRMLPSHVTLQDLSSFIPVLANFRERIDLELDANGTIDQLNCPRLQVSAGNHLIIRGDVELQDLSNPVDAFIYGRLTRLSADREGVDFLVRNMVDNYTVTPPLVQRLGDISFDGEITGYFTDLVTYGNLRTELGMVKGDVKLSSNKAKGTFSYSGGLESEDFQLGYWFNDNKWRNISYKINVESEHYRERYPHATVEGVVSSIEYNEYKYENITLDGEYKNGGFEGVFALNDANGSVSLNGKINLTERIPVFNFYADIHHVRPHNLKLTPDYEGAEFSLKINANFKGRGIDDMIGNISVDSVSFTAPQKDFFVPNISLSATNLGADKKVLQLNSNFLQAKIEGEYSYRSIKNSFMNIVSQYLPSLFAAQDIQDTTGKNNFTLDVNIYNTDILPMIFDIPLTVYNHSVLKGYFNDYNRKLKLEGYFPRFQYGNMFVESGMILCENSTDDLHGRVRFSNHRKKGVVNMSIDARAKDDRITNKLNWGNNAIATYSGHFEALASFFRSSEESPLSPLKTVIDIAPTNVILNDTVWDIHPSQVVIHPKLVRVDNFLFSKEDQFLRINGYASDDMRSSLIADLKDINIGYVFDLFNFRSVDFHGIATGQARINRALKEPVMNTNLSIKNFHFNNALLGDLNIYGEWDNEKKGIYLDAIIKEGDISTNNVTGYIFPVKPNQGLDLDIRAKNINAGFMHEYLDGLVSNLKGRASGHVRLHGGFKSLNIEGKANANATFKVDVLNTYFAINDSINLLEKEISFDNVRFTDMEGHQGNATGYVRHQNFKNMNYRFQINANNLLVMDTKEDPDMPFYGTIYSTGNALLYGDSDAFNVEAALTTNRNTNFVYTLAESPSAVSNQFIKFVDKTPTRTFKDSIQLYSDFELAQQRQSKSEDDDEADLRINIQIDATPDATIRIIMDPTSGDYISGTGTGNIRAEYFNKGDVRMFGNYIINQGVYKFSLQEVIRKDFMITQGSNIMFNGNPGDAMLDIQAIYTVNSASLTDLIPENSELIKRRNVKVNCLMNLAGVLYRPTIKLGLELPNEREEIQELVRNYVSTEEEINMQILYLLGIGKFYTPDNMYSTQNSNMMTSVISSTLSGQLNNIFSQFMDNKNWNFGTNVSTGERGWTDVEVEGILSAQLLNNRLLINGNFGYRENPLSDTNFIGDFDAQWLLIPSGDLRLKAYNQTNDRFITRTNLTTQGIGILYKKDFDRWRDLFFWNNWRKKKVEMEKKEVKEEEE